jgi:hypothetical protein
VRHNRETSESAHLTLSIRPATAHDNGLTRYFNDQSILKNCIDVLEERSFKQLVSIPDRGLPEICQLSRLTPDDIVELRLGVFGSLRRETDGIVVLLPGRRMTCPLTLEPALAIILSGVPVRIRDLPGLDEAEQCHLVKELVLAGVLRFSDRGPR